MEKKRKATRMPELPEVEVTRRAIEPFATGKTIARAIVRRRDFRRPLDPEFERTAQGAVVTGVGRRSKYLLLRLSGGRPALVAHLGMSGVLMALPAGDRRLAAPEKHDHLDLAFADGSALRYRDPRRFGLWALCADERSDPLFARLGPEPLGDEFTAACFLSALKGRTGPIKSVLMSNELVVGVGNIYANEALFAARVHPRARACDLSAPKARALRIAVIEALTAAIRRGGSTIRDFRDPLGEEGLFALDCAVYGKEGEPCPRCSTPIRRDVFGGRSAFYCPRCQRLPRPRA